MFRFLVPLVIFHASAFGAGFESSIPFGGESAGRAGIGASYMRGSQALFFNPAGLSPETQKQDVSLNLSPGYGRFHGPILDPNKAENSETKTLFPFGLMYARNLTGDLAVGAGIYAPGGSYAKYTGVDLSGAGINGAVDLKSDLSILEYALGVSYKVTNQLSVGASWRVLSVNANFSTFDPSGAALDLKDLKDTRYNGYKLGARYQFDADLDVGFTYRSEVAFRAKGQASVTDFSSGSAVSAGSGDVTVGSLFPAAYTLGASYRSAPAWRWFGEYVFTQYSRVTNLAVDRTGQAGTPMELHFHDQNEFRIAGEYAGLMMPIRLGYIWSSQVTNDSYAAATFTPPAPANTITLGSGYAIGTIKVDGALEYGWSRGQGPSPATYALESYGLHLGLDYAF